MGEDAAPLVAEGVLQGLAVVPGAGSQLSAPPAVSMRRGYPARVALNRQAALETRPSPSRGGRSLGPESGGWPETRGPLSGQPSRMPQRTTMA